MSETGKGKVKKEALLNDNDNLWAEFRHEHIAKVLSDLGKYFQCEPLCTLLQIHHTILFYDAVLLFYWLYL